MNNKNKELNVAPAFATRALNNLNLKEQNLSEEMKRFSNLTSIDYQMALNKRRFNNDL